ncbi:hypothetical protein ABTY53_30415 [Streptomyces noursei]|uniref:hypothetical protein n=1 Tax=Streptomyces noursei TaxID=1971 RepID=UPI00331F9DAF
MRLSHTFCAVPAATAALLAWPSAPVSAADPPTIPYVELFKGSPQDAAQIKVAFCTSPSKPPNIIKVTAQALHPGEQPTGHCVIVQPPKLPTGPPPPQQRNGTAPFGVDVPHAVVEDTVDNVRALHIPLCAAVTNAVATLSLNKLPQTPTAPCTLVDGAHLVGTLSTGTGTGTGTGSGTGSGPGTSTGTGPGTSTGTGTGPGTSTGTGT